MCLGFPCANGGSCVDLQGLAYKCLCPAGFTGHDCHIDIDECDSKPCKNGGLCRDSIDTFTCDCLEGFTGSMCERALNASLVSAYQDSGSDVALTADSSIREINLIYLISAVILSLLLLVTLSLVFLMRRRSRHVEKERRKDEELARTQNESNSRSLKNKCLSSDEDDREFRGNRIVNNLNDCSSIKQKELVFNNKLDPHGSSHQLNRSLTLPRFNNIDHQQLQLQRQPHQAKQLPHQLQHHHLSHQVHHHPHILKHPCHHQSTHKLGPATVNLQKSPLHHTSQHNLSTFKSVGTGLYV